MTLTPRVKTGRASGDRLSHLTPNERAGLAAFVDRLRQRYGGDLLHVVLFGSKARGDFDDESDLDVLVVVRLAGSSYRKHWDEIVDIAWDVEFAHNLVITLVIKDEVGYASMCKHRLLLVRNIEQDGIELWTTRPNESLLESA